MDFLVCHLTILWVVVVVQGRRTIYVYIMGNYAEG